MKVYTPSMSKDQSPQRSCMAGELNVGQLLRRCLSLCSWRSTLKLFQMKIKKLKSSIKELALALSLDCLVLFCLAETFCCVKCWWCAFLFLVPELMDIFGWSLYACVLVFPLCLVPSRLSHGGCFALSCVWSIPGLDLLGAVVHSTLVIAIVIVFSWLPESGMCYAGTLEVWML
jgi:hypothetical protein